MSPASRERPCLLVAEDERAMRELLVEILRADGYDVLEAKNGRELFWVVETAPRPVAVVITDVKMPAYDGLEVAEAWAARGGGPRLVLMSAFPDACARKRAEALGVTLLHKPFEISVLQEIVRRLVDEGANP